MKKSYDSKFKSRVALEALRGDLTRHEVPQSRTSFVLQPIEKICGEKQKTKKISFSICFMVRAPTTKSFSAYKHLLVLTPLNWCSTIGV